MTAGQLIEFVWGLADSQKPFLWIIRLDLVASESVVLPPEFMEEIAGRGMLASWCRQEEVLKQWMIGGFLTHSRWNLTLESLCSSMLVICWHFFAEQQTNCRYSCMEWGIVMEIDYRDLPEGASGRGTVEERWWLREVESRRARRRRNDVLISKQIAGRRGGTKVFTDERRGRETEAEPAVIARRSEIGANRRKVEAEWRREEGVNIDNDVKRDEVEGLVRELMEGEKGTEMRKKAMEWKAKAEEAIMPGGTSYNNVDNLISELLLSID
ncbi:(R)-mandelonitrile beta-glucosyltransferase-like [Eucalyptus grandis]|uniref:(R)-mandelonitrile beta-glucosyltransferase-like n=1 Tax=Eucalyptus grandis TaxID=71139 RepID=UPI00192EFDB7|nr:(R)-mandelonitrile beta-glucosyltransferase-like [Eucalyptus grandis]